MEERRKAETTSKAVSTEPTAVGEAEEEDEVAILERRIREAQEAKAKRKAEKKARKSGAFSFADSPATDSWRLKSPVEEGNHNTETPVKRPDIFKSSKADEKSSTTPKFSFSPRAPAPGKDEFAATMERLKEAERQRLADEIRKKEAETAQ